MSVHDMTVTSTNLYHESSSMKLLQHTQIEVFSCNLMISPLCLDIEVVKHCSKNNYCIVKTVKLIN